MCIRDIQQYVHQIAYFYSYLSISGLEYVGSWARLLYDVETEKVCRRILAGGDLDLDDDVDEALLDLGVGVCGDCDLGLNGDWPLFLAFSYFLDSAYFAGGRGGVDELDLDLDLDGDRRPLFEASVCAEN